VTECNSTWRRCLHFLEPSHQRCAPGLLRALNQLCSECISKFQISTLLNAELKPEDHAELADAENLAMRFL
jgi:hypothetical protein